MDNANIQQYYVGVMSGTSMDAIDIAIVSFSDAPSLLTSASFDIPDSLRDKLSELCQPGPNEIQRMSEADSELAELISSNINSIIDSAGLERRLINAIGSHGQTIRHMPNTLLAYTLQIGNGALIAELTGITTITDFRRADIAAGGQGAPLVPAFHHSIFADNTKPRVIVNIGGMANITILPTQDFQAIAGFDTGPGNILLNSWIQQQRGLPYDKNGNWSASQAYDEELLAYMLHDNYFSLAPPKSTGREHFNLDWINQTLNSYGETVSADVVQSTLCELTATTICNAIHEYANGAGELILCGGGVHNYDLVSRIRKISKAEVFSSSELGVDPDFVEAMAFAWLAKQTLDNKPGNVPAVTGASRRVVLGAIYPRSANDT